MKPIQLPDIPANEQTPLVKTLVEIIETLAERVQQQGEMIGQLKDEIAVLKGEKKRPIFKPSKMDEQAGKDPQKSSESKKRPGSEKRSKTRQLPIHQEVVIAPAEPIPEHSRFKGYQDYVVQELKIAAENVLYRLACWETPTGEILRGVLPESVDGHFGPILRGYILYQYHHAHVTQPLLLEQLREWGIDISSGQINALLTEGHEALFEEKQEILRAGLETARVVTVDDTGARHQGKNGYSTHIGNEYFAWFESTDSKSRENFLGLLRAGHEDYRIDEDALFYMRKQKLPVAIVERLKNHPQSLFPDRAQWLNHLRHLGITAQRHITIATEGALLASAFSHGLNRDLVIVSDDAGQFCVLLLLHALCWIHAERTIHKLNPLNESHRAVIESVRDQIWTLYADLKVYRQHPTEEHKTELSTRFDVIFTQKTPFATLNNALQRLYRNKAELLLVLERPETPLHTNDSERDIRGLVKKRKVSGGTRSPLGRQCRDTFASAKRTCRKLGISFWNYLLDRLSGVNEIPPLPLLIRRKAEAQSQPAMTY